MNLITANKNIIKNYIINKYENIREKIQDHEYILYILFLIIFFPLIILIRNIFTNQSNIMDNNTLTLIVKDGSKSSQIDLVNNLKDILKETNDRYNKIIIYVNEFEEKDLINLKFLKSLGLKVVNFQKKKLEIIFDTKVNKEVQKKIIKHLNPYHISSLEIKSS